MGPMTMKEHEADVRRVARRMPQIVAKAMNTVAPQMVATSRRKHLSGPRMPRGRSGGFWRSTLASKTGMVRRIHHKVKIKGKTVEGAVGTNLTNQGYSYPRAHEYGLGRMPERPWLRPAVYAHQDDLQKEIVQGYLRAYGRRYT